jgi:MFS transporter, DHA2 family, glioxin efflux transporter
MQTSESDQPSSTVASSTANDTEKPEDDGENDTGIEKAKVDQPSKTVEYPKGLEMFFIMLALVLSITLCSMDQVSFLSSMLSLSRLLPTHHISSLLMYLVQTIVATAVPKITDQFGRLQDIS